MIAEGETGYTVPCDDVTALTDRFCTLLSHLPRNATGWAGRRRAEERFSGTVVASRMGDHL